MSNHLSRDQVTEWVSGTNEEGVKLHLEACDVCRFEVERVRATLAGFHDSVHALAQRDDSFWRRQQFAIRERLSVKSWFPSASWVWATAMLVVLVASLLMMRTSRIPRYGTTEAADEILLQEVQGDIAREYPEALAPAVLIAEERNEILNRKSSHPSKNTSREGVQ
ncbi:MAG: hypothetical protein LAO31_19085 [Acidobacteriia bacterium]|nr:hypothetical protein [Terriglobia bacterium]